MGRVRCFAWSLTQTTRGTKQYHLLLVLVLACWCPWAVEAFAAQLQHSLLLHIMAHVLHSSCASLLLYKAMHARARNVFWSCAVLYFSSPTCPGARHAMLVAGVSNTRRGRQRCQAPVLLTVSLAFPYVCSCVLFAESSALQRGWMRLVLDLLQLCHGSCFVTSARQF